VLLAPDPALAIVGGAPGLPWSTTHSADVLAGNTLWRTVDTSGAARLNISGPRTVGGWRRFDTVATSIIHGIHGGGAERNFFIQFFAGIGLRCFYYDDIDGANEVRFPWTPIAGDWNRLDVSIDPDSQSGAVSIVDRIRFYLNGADFGDGTIAFEGSQNVTRRATASSAVYGLGNFAKTSSAFDGRMDDDTFHSKIRSEAEIAADYNTDKDLSDPTLEAWWGYDNDAWVDKTTNSLDLSTTGAPTFSADTPKSPAP
jgi:hypothetical protein